MPHPTRWVTDNPEDHPRRYVDRTNEASITDLVPGEEAMVLARVELVRRASSSLPLPPDWALRASGYIRISELTHYQHVAGKLALRFPGGEKLDEDFVVDACPR